MKTREEVQMMVDRLASYANGVHGDFFVGVAEKLLQQENDLKQIRQNTFTHAAVEKIFKECMRVAWNDR